MSMTNWLSIIAVLVFGWVSRQSPKMGLWLAWLFIPAYLWQIDLGPLPSNFWELAVAGLAIVTLALDWRRARGSLTEVWRSLGWAGGLLLAGLAIGVAVSPDLRLSFGVAKGWFIVPLVFFWLNLHWLRASDLGHYILALILSTIPLSLVALSQTAAQRFVTVDGRASGWFVSANYLSMYLVPILILGIILVQTGVAWQRRLVYLAWWLGGLALYFSFSFGGWLALVMAMLVWAVIRWRRRWREWIWGLALPIIAVATQWRSERWQQMIDLTDRSSASVRLQVWQTAGLMIKEHPLTGIGLGEFRDQYLSYATRLFASPWEMAILHAHNVYLQFWINAGLAGLVGWLWLVIKFFRRAIGRVTPTTTGLVAAMVAILGHGLIDTTYWKNDLAALFWLVFAMMVVATKTRPAAD
ncbi:MAG: O-antigen polymerase [candidate division Kazan bacterium GW2011_GWA1_50_15]|uniref:O-antigen polymerase n=2 Tax=Bacteria division Kazan-3B-28 TaxID=1798534 RepID=A0A0G1X892_UNCK3|nr:MAG: O-antigen polymerase [candidate division Kazan bacterium GW2011_GWA1_50_15]KKW25779.1 MAG: O-antigen polymerase [candidate division Kazan bacterium GW2011_GWC1_52_13]KKW27206.1 MAG: O-antigen polymerase [candidate division Kazan bacterium GW2011_GWB1_52_7]HCR42497.1 hypothetical protein [Patescibacteria group bacterium]